MRVGGKHTEQQKRDEIIRNLRKGVLAVMIMSTLVVSVGSLMVLYTLNLTSWGNKIKA